MYPRSHRLRSSIPGAQRGQAIIFTTVLLALGVLAAVFTATGSPSVSISNKQAADTDKAMLEVKNALIAWSVARTPTASNPNARPGELPCPDTDNNGYAENDDDNDGVDTANCVAGSIGRVPWKTLGIPEPKDGTGETLWYALSGNFRVYRSATPNVYTSPITSNTLGTLTVYRESASNTITSQAIAVIFAPGVALGMQDRSTTTTMSCSAPSGTYFRYQCASNYLETYGGVNNAGVNGPFIRGTSSSTFNDRLLVITTEDLMPIIEQRMAREMISYLNRYRAALGYYPWADLGNGDGNGAEGTYAYNRNRFPCGSTQDPPISWLAVIGENLPSWLTNGCASATGWAGVVYYTVAKNRLQNSGSGCAPWPNCTSSTLSITNSGGLVATECDTSSPPTCVSKAISAGSADLLLITPGAWDGTTSLTWPITGWTAISGYFEDPENFDNDDDNYVVATSTSYNRDRIYIVR